MQQTVSENDPTRISGSDPTQVMRGQEQTQAIDPAPLTPYSYTCAVCHHQVSRCAQWCPQCNHPNPEFVQKVNEQNVQLGFMAVIFLIIIIVIAVLAADCSSIPYHPYIPN